MPRVETIEAEVQSLSQEEFEELREWMLEKDWQRWDQQIEADAAAGKLDKLFEKEIDLSDLPETPPEAFARAIVRIGLQPIAAARSVK